MLRRSIRFRLTLWYVAFLALTLAAFGTGVYFALRQSLNDGLEDSLRARAGIVRAVTSSSGVLDAQGVELPGDPLEGEEFVRLYDSAGNVILDNSPPAYRTEPDSPSVSLALAGQERLRHARADDLTLRVLTAPIETEQGIIGVVEVGLTDEEVRETLTALLLIVAVAYPIALIVASGGGIFLAGRALGPIDQVTRAAQRIGAEDLSRRLDLDLPDDEVGRLAKTFDGMIGRLDEAFQRQRQFTADASHELRTPLTAMKGQAEVALQRERSAAEYREALTRVNLEVDRMIRLLGSMLTLARADASRIPINWERLSLRAVVEDAMESIAPAAQGKGIELGTSNADNVEVVGDQDLILQLLLNLLDNAVKYTPAQGRIDVSFGEALGAPDEVDLVVSDSGEGIPPDHVPHVFERFYRVYAPRSRAQGGAGLGLSICRWIAEAHGGGISLESSPGRGSSFRVRLPSRLR